MNTLLRVPGCDISMNWVSDNLCWRQTRQSSFWFYLSRGMFTMDYVGDHGEREGERGESGWIWCVSTTKVCLVGWVWVWWWCVEATVQFLRKKKVYQIRFFSLNPIEQSSLPSTHPSKLMFVLLLLCYLRRVYLSTFSLVHRLLGRPEKESFMQNTASS